jgi:hypothetical protein
MRWFLTRWLPAALLGLLLSYIGALSIFAYQANSAIQEAKRIYDSIQSEGFSDQTRKDLEEFVPTAMGLRITADGPLVKPYISLSGFGHEVESAFEIFDYIAPAIPGLAEIYFSKEQKRYLVAFQNSAEARGTGGIIGAFAIVSIRNGRVSIERTGSNILLKSQPALPISMPAEFINLYRNDAAIWQNSNLSPHFPYGARIWLALWQKQFSEQLDGVITLDAVVLSYLLKTTGPIQVQSNEINSENVVREALSDSYLKYERNNAARKQYLVEIIEKAGVATLSPDISPVSLITSLSQPLEEHRILIYSTNRAIQASLRKSKIAGYLSSQPSNEYRLVLQNTAGNKMDFYLDRKLIIKTKSCGKNRETEVSFTIRNTAKKDEYLPAYVKGRLDLNLPEGLSNSTSVAALMYGPPGAVLISAIDKVTGEAVGYPKKELGREIFVLPLTLKAGESRSFDLKFKGGVGPISAHIQPLVRPQMTKLVDACKK